MLFVLRKNAVLIVIIVLFITIISIVMALSGNVENTLSQKQLCQYINYDLSNAQIYNVSIEPYNYKSELNNTSVVGTRMCIKLNITEQQQTEIINTLTLTDSISPGDKQLLDDNDIDTNAVRQTAVSWNEYESKSFFSTTYKPYDINWFFLETGYNENYNALICTSLPFAVQTEYNK